MLTVDGLLEEVGGWPELGECFSGTSQLDDIDVAGVISWLILTADGGRVCGTFAEYRLIPD